MHFVNVRHVSFDLWLTLIKSNPVFKPKRDELLTEFFKIPHPIAAVSARVRAWDLHFNAINEASGRNLDAAEMVLIILADLGVDIRQIDAAMMEDYYRQMETLFFEYHPLPYEDKLIDFLTQLQAKGMTMSLLSNTGFIKGATLKQLLEKLEIAPLLRFQIYSDEIRCSKPSKEAYQHVVDRIQAFSTIGPGSILHIGDNEHADFRGAQKYGLQSALIHSNEVSLLSLNIHP